MRRMRTRWSPAFRQSARLRPRSRPISFQENTELNVHPERSRRRSRGTLRGALSRLRACGATLETNGGAFGGDVHCGGGFVVWVWFRLAVERWVHGHCLTAPAVPQTRGWVSWLVRARLERAHPHGPVPAQHEGARRGRN